MAGVIDSPRKTVPMSTASTDERRYANMTVVGRRRLYSQIFATRPTPDPTMEM
jgi:hypothetical protein